MKTQIAASLLASKIHIKANSKIQDGQKKKIKISKYEDYPKMWTKF